MPLTNAEFAILSVLAEAPKHGYAIEQLVEERGMRNWTEIGFSSIYFLLKKLETRGFVEVEDPSLTSRRTPKVYRLTEAGKLAHREETRQALTEPEALYPAFLLGLANWPALPPHTAAEALQARAAALDQKLRELEKRRTAQEPLPTFVRAMFDYSGTMIEAEQAWLSKAQNLFKEAAVEKVDFKKTLKTLYNPPAGKFVIVDVPPLNYFMVDGAGDPNKAPAYKEAIEGLYAASYTLKFMSKEELSRDYVVPPLEGVWWAEDMTSFRSRQKDNWLWTMLVMVPEFIDGTMAERAIAAAAKKKALRALSKLRFERLEEGQAVQTLHVGSYDDEGPILKRLHEEFLPENGLIEAGHHHEIYLSDPRKTAPQKLKTILRHPVRKR